jgi:hypothetical protein
MLPLGLILFAFFLLQVDEQTDHRQQQHYHDHKKQWTADKVTHGLPLSKNGEKGSPNALIPMSIPQHPPRTNAEALLF